MACRQQRQAAVRSMGNLGVQPCVVTALSLLAGPCADPFLYQPVAQIKLWCELWAKAQGKEERKEITFAWRTAKAFAVAQGSGRWSKCSGPIAATICTLMDNNWEPTLPSRWRAPCGTIVAVIDQNASAPGMVARFFEETLRRRLWTDASGFRCT